MYFGLTLPGEMFSTCILLYKEIFYRQYCKAGHFGGFSFGHIGSLGRPKWSRLADTQIAPIDDPADL